MKKINKYFLILLSISILFFSSCTEQPEKKIRPEGPASDVVHPAWSKNANIYEVNIRQYTPEGTFKAFEEHLPRLKEMGVDILWIMPIFPVGEKNRKGPLGSYYAVQDYTKVNPEFGTPEDFEGLVVKAHQMGFKVILDWVANHTAWDNPWITAHPDWYTRDSLGNMISPADWTDVADLNYDAPVLRDSMIAAMKYWVSDFDVDGFRCDVAGMVPTDFWDRVRTELDSIKPVFMLAEAEDPLLQIHAFDMTYAWELHHIYNSIAKGKMNANDIEAYFKKQDTVYPHNAYRMDFITNHDENSWNGTIEERLGNAKDVFAMLTFTLPGMPLIYSGQEVGLDKRLEFFKKDTIEWDLNSSLINYYTSLIELKHDNKALWNGEYGGWFNRISTSDTLNVLAFGRRIEDKTVVVISNLSPDTTEFTITDRDYAGRYRNFFTGARERIRKGTKLDLIPWEYMILVSR